MAHSIEIYKEKTAIINDADLLVIIGFAIEMIRQSPDFVGFKNLALHWKQSILQYGPGVIDLKLEQFITTPDEIQEFRALLSAILKQASQPNKIISAQVLNKLVSAPGVTFGDYKVSYLEEAINKLHALVADI